MTCVDTFSGNSVKKRNNEYSQKTGFVKMLINCQELNAEKLTKPYVPGVLEWFPSHKNQNLEGLILLFQHSLLAPNLDLQNETPTRTPEK